MIKFSLCRPQLVSDSRTPVCRIAPQIGLLSQPSSNCCSASSISVILEGMHMPHCQTDRLTSPPSYRRQEHLCTERQVRLFLAVQTDICVVCRWVGDALAVQARAKTVVRLREDQQTGELRSVHIPDHLDILVRCAVISHLIMPAQERVVV